MLDRVRLMAMALVLALGGCASAPGPNAQLGLKLAPAALGTAVSVVQHLKIERQGRVDELDAVLEVDGGQLELVGLVLGQRVLSLHYDGVKLSSWRHFMLPAQVKAEDVLDDLQLTLWPQEAIAKALPPGWRVEDEGLRRTIYMGQAVIASFQYSGMPRWSGTVVLDNLRYNYRLTIQTAP